MFTRRKGFSFISLFSALGIVAGIVLLVVSDQLSFSRKSLAVPQLPDRPTAVRDSREVLAEHPAMVGCLAKAGAAEVECINDYLKRLTEEKGARPALDTIEAVVQAEPQLLAAAHPFAHTIGLHSLRHYRQYDLALESQLGLALVSCDGFGSFGCYHGVIEVGLTKIPQAKRAAIIRKACLEDPYITQRPYFVQQCAHWFGHGVVTFTDTSLLDALLMCEGLDPRWGSGGVQLCLSGVFHAGLAPGEIEEEEVLRNIGKVFKAGDPYYPCAEVPERFRGHCYSHAYGRALGPDIGTQLKTCDNIPEPDPAKKRVYIGGCYDSVGNNVIEQSGFDVGQVIANCRAEARPEYRPFCYGGAARYWVLRNPLLENVNPIELCRGVEAAAKPFCYARAGFGNFENFASPEIARQFCSRAEPAYERFCLSRTAPDDFTGGYRGTF